MHHFTFVPSVDYYARRQGKQNEAGGHFGRQTGEITKDGFGEAIKR